jgi:hypothetical protein
MNRSQGLSSWHEHEMKVSNANACAEATTAACKTRSLRSKYARIFQDLAAC